MSREDIDDLLEWYLEGTMPVDAVTKAECAKRHKELSEAMKEAIREASKNTVTSIKLWVIGAILAAVLSVVGGYTCAMTEIGAYRERIDNNTRQLDKLEKGQNYLLQILIGQKAERTLQ